MFVGRPLKGLERRVQVSLRVEPGVLARVDAVRGGVSRSDWIVGVVEGALASGVDGCERPVREGRVGPPEGFVSSEGCGHPKGSERVLPYAVLCGVCGVRLR